jgi:uncharacterized protein YcbX
MNIVLEYKNKHGKTVTVNTTYHAVKRWRERWRAAFPEDNAPAHKIDQQLALWFSRATRINPTNRHYERRYRRSGKDTLYFKYNLFVFVVQSASLVTVELGSKDTRYLNKPRMGSLINHEPEHTEPAPPAT